MSSTFLLSNARWFDPAGDRGFESVLVRDGRIDAVGERRSLRALLPSVEEIDLAGALVLPALTDTHTHFYEWSRRLAGIDLSDCRGFDEVEARLREKASGLPDQPRWIGGSGWSPDFFGERERFDRQVLDEIFGSRPVALEARDFHTLWCNTAALEEAGLMGERPVAVPAGGRVGRAADGSPDGLLYETAWELIRSARPAESDEVADRWLDHAESRAHALGLTAVHCMEPMASLAHYRRRARSAKAGLRVCFHTPLDDLEARIERGEPSHVGEDPWLRLGGVKIFMDGSLGSRTAAMSTPYPDGSHGTLILEPEQLVEILTRAAEADIAGTVHAIGDRTVDVVASAFERERRRAGSVLLHRLEHAQCVRPEAAERLGRAGVFCAMQPVHLEDDIARLETEWGESARYAYPTRTLRESGVTIGLGSDTPVADPDPRRGLFAAVARRVPGSGAREAFHPEQALSVVEALAGYTSSAAVAWGGERRGRIEEGQPADLTAIDDVRHESADAWLQARVRLTMVDGEVRYDSLAGA